MKNTIEQFYATEKPGPESLSTEKLYRSLAKLIRPDLAEPGRHELALELSSAKGDRDKLLKLYKKLTGEKGDLVDTYA